MNDLSSWWLLAVATLLTAACANPGEEPRTRRDAGPEAIRDAGGTRDAGATPDAGDTLDAGDTRDAGPSTPPGPRQEHTATLLDDGRLLVVGGRGGAGFDIFVFSATPDRWDRLPALAEGRVQHTATQLDDGRVLIAGGASATAVLLDPTTAERTPTGSLAGRRAGHHAFLLHTGPNVGRVLILGGFDAALLTTAELYDPVAGTFASYPAADLPEPRDGATLTKLDDGRILIAGGATIPGGGGIRDTALLFDPATEQLTPTATPMAVPRRFAAAARLSDGRVMIAGGTNLSGLVEVDIFDPATNAFSSAAPLPEARFFAALVALDAGRALLVGGSRTEPTDTVFDYEPTTGWSTHSHRLVQPLAFVTADVLPDGRVMVVGGQTTMGIVAGTAEIFVP